MKLELGGGSFSKGGDWVNMDQCETADICHNLDVRPWPIEDDSVTDIYSSHCIEHVQDPHAFLEECARIGRIGCWIEIRCPHPQADLAMVAGHRHVFSPQQAVNMEHHFPHLTWKKPKRVKLVSYRIQPTERLAEAKRDLPFLAGLSDEIILKYFPGTQHDVVYQYAVKENEFYGR